MRFLKIQLIPRLLSYLVDLLQSINLSYLCNFGSLLIHIGINYYVILIHGSSLLEHLSLLLLLILSIVLFVAICHNHHKSYETYGDFLSVWSGLLYDIFSNLEDNCILIDVYTSLFMYLGLAMLTLNFLFNRKSSNVSITEKLKIFWCNKELFLMFFFIIFIINLTLYITSMSITIVTASLLLFFYTIFCKVILLKFVIILVIYIITGEITLSNFYVSLEHIIVIMFLSYLNVYYLIPFIGLALIHITDAVKMLTCSVKPIDCTSLKTGLIHIMKSNVLTCKFLYIIDLYRMNSFSFNRYSPFRIYYSNLFIMREIIYLKPRIFSYIPLSLPKIMPVTHTYTGIIHCKNTLNILTSRIKENIWSNSDYIYKLFSTKYNVDCKIRLYNNNSYINISANIKNGLLEKLDIYKTQSKFYSKPEDFSSDTNQYTPNGLNKSVLLFNTDPYNVGYETDISVNMQHSTNDSEPQSSFNQTRDDSSISRGRRRADELTLSITTNESTSTSSTTLAAPLSATDEIPPLRFIDHSELDLTKVGQNMRSLKKLLQVQFASLLDAIQDSAGDLLGLCRTYPTFDVGRYISREIFSLKRENALASRSNEFGLANLTLDGRDRYIKNLVKIYEEEYNIICRWHDQVHNDPQRNIWYAEMIDQYKIHMFSDRRAMYTVLNQLNTLENRLLFEKDLLYSGLIDGVWGVDANPVAVNLSLMKSYTEEERTYFWESLFASRLCPS